MCGNASTPQKIIQATAEAGGDLTLEARQQNNDLTIQQVGPQGLLGSRFHVRAGDGDAIRKCKLLCLRDEGGMG
jgi:hypothetical protein